MPFTDTHTRPPKDEKTWVWTDVYRVRTYETDPSGHASIQSLCNYLQETAGRHAESLGWSVEHLNEAGLTWFLARLHVVLDAHPTYGDVLRLTTWPGGHSGPYAHREFEVTFEDGRPLARATSAWLLIDLERRRPIRLPEALRSLHLPGRPALLPHEAPKLTPPDEIAHERAFHVRYSDMDLNNHTNNVCYIEWALETLPRAYLDANRPYELEVLFRAETETGDVIGATAGAAGTGEAEAFRHRLRRDRDGRDVALVHSRWAPDVR